MVHDVVWLRGTSVTLLHHATTTTTTTTAFTVRAFSLQTWTCLYCIAESRCVEGNVARKRRTEANTSLGADGRI
jgi:hypothetical protein